MVREKDGTLIRWLRLAAAVKFALTDRHTRRRLKWMKNGPTRKGGAVAFGLG